MRAWKYVKPNYASTAMRGSNGHEIVYQVGAEIRDASGNGIYASADIKWVCNYALRTYGHRVLALDYDEADVIASDDGIGRVLRLGRCQVTEELTLEEIDRHATQTGKPPLDVWGPIAERERAA